MRTRSKRSSEPPVHASAVAPCQIGPLTRLSPTMVDLAVLRRFIPQLWILGPAWFRRRLVSLLPKTSTIRKVAAIVDTINSRSRETYEAKKAALSKGDADALTQFGEGKDIMSILSKAMSFFRMMARAHS